jgi:hypothetical protein
MRSGAGLFLAMVQAFYDGVLSRLMLTPKPKPYIKRLITSLLAGDVFDADARWQADARQRMTRPAMLEMLAQASEIAT